jgi:hypothetical protein
MEDFACRALEKIIGNFCRFQFCGCGCCGAFLILFFKKLGFPTDLHCKTSISGVFVAGITPSISPCGSTRGVHRRNTNVRTGLYGTHNACCNVLIADFFPDLSHRALVGPVS